MDHPFTDPNWTETTTLLLAAINASLGEPALVAVRRPFDESALAKAARDLALGGYRPTEWFLNGEITPFLNATGEPPVTPEVTYRLLTLSGARQDSRHVSMRFGGIAYEDPFYALLACHNIGLTRKLLLLPATSAAFAWEQRGIILDSLRLRQYLPERYFVECRSVGMEPGGPPLRELSVSGQDLLKLRHAGTADIRPGGRFAKLSMYAF
jgi:hypothetical protein